MPLVVDEYPDLPIREQFDGGHKQLVILDRNGKEVGRITLNSGVNCSAENYITEIIEENYVTSIPGDTNGDDLINVLDIVLLVNIVLGQSDSTSGSDVNGDGIINILDIVALVNIVLSGK